MVEYEKYSHNSSIPIRKKKAIVIWYEIKFHSYISVFPNIEQLFVLILIGK